MKRCLEFLFGVVVAAIPAADIASAATVRYPLRGDALFTVELPSGWKPPTAGAANEVRAESAGRDTELVLRASHADLDGRAIDDEVARLTDASYTKLEFSNLHQRRIVNGRRFVVFRGSGRDRVRGVKSAFEIYAFAAGGETGMLFFRHRGAAAHGDEIAEAIVESVKSSR